MTAVLQNMAQVFVGFPVLLGADPSLPTDKRGVCFGASRNPICSAANHGTRHPIGGAGVYCKAPSFSISMCRAVFPQRPAAAFGPSGAALSNGKVEVSE